MSRSQSIRQSMCMVLVYLIVSASVGLMLGEALPKSPSWMVFTFAGAFVWSIAAALWFGGVEISMGWGAPDFVFRPRPLLATVGCAIMFWATAMGTFAHELLPDERAYLPTFPFALLAFALLLGAYWPRKDEQAKA